MSRLKSLVLFLGALSIAASLHAADDDLVVQTESGAVRGMAKSNYAEFLGIPYAAPPVGELRWQAPAAAASWSGVRDATKPGSGCMQGAGWDPGYEEVTLTEDCLFMNVYRPHADTSESRLPVFVWIHGGGLRGGAGYDTDPRKFVNQGNVVFVTFNYRLGAMGFLATPSLSAENRDSAGMYGLLDQQSALQWVKRNIENFGGDPDHITIAGQSAGGRSVCNQLISPNNKGLFVAAFHQSGSCGGVTLADAEATGTRFAAAVGCGDPATAASCMRGKSVAEILAGQDEVRISQTVYGGAHFPMHPTEAIRTGAFNRVPVVMGQTFDERTQSMFSARDFRGNPVTEAQFESELQESYGADANDILALYPVGDYWSPTIALSTVEGDERSCERRALYGYFAANTPTYVYEFDERDAPAFVSIWRLHTDFPFGATHVNELGYIFDYLRQALPFSAAQGELSDQMIGYWSNFTKTGDPNGANLPDWPRYSTNSGRMMSLKAGDTKVKTNFTEQHKCDFWDARGS